MHTKTFIAATIAGSLVSAAAFAQATAPSQAPATQQQPMNTQSQPTQTQMNQSAADRSAQDMRPIAAVSAGQMLSDDLVGTRVYGANNENIGEINNLLLDHRDGRIVAAIIGVGGFLGIGEKNVAVPFSALEFVDNDNAMATSSTAPADPSAGTAANRPAGTSTTVTDRAGSATDRTAGTSATTRTTASTMEPDRVVLRGMTKAELEAAPKFDPRMADAGTMNRPATTNPATTNQNRAPATTAPAAPAPAQNR